MQVLLPHRAGWPYLSKPFVPNVVSVVIIVKDVKTIRTRVKYELLYFKSESLDFKSKNEKKKTKINENENEIKKQQLKTSP